MKRQVSEHLFVSSTRWATFDELEIKELMGDLQEWLDKGYSHVLLEVDCDESNAISVTAIYYREETDEEYNRRLEKEEYWAREAELRDRETYERLKAKYENKGN